MSGRCVGEWNTSGTKSRIVAVGLVAVAMIALKDASELSYKCRSASLEISRDNEDAEVCAPKADDES